MLGGGALAAEITATRPTPELQQKLSELSSLHAVIDMEGPIEPGDAEALSRLVADMELGQQVSGASGVEVVVRLDSPGGSFSEGIKIARIIDQNQLQTFVEAGDECLSACAVIFMAGVYQPGTRQQERSWRKVEWPVKLGFHRPFIADLVVDMPPEVLGQLSPEEIVELFGSEFAAAFDTANQLIQEMVGVDPADWSPELLVKMLTATETSPGGNFVYLETVDDALTWGVELANAVPPGGSTDHDRYAENFWLCYNSGRAIPAYDGIWPDLDASEETLRGNLESCCGRQGALWDSKMVADDDLTYWARVRGWYFGCTIEYEEAEAAPKVTFFHDDAVVTQTHFLQRYNPGTKLDETIDRGGAGSQIQAEEIEGRCYVFRGDELLDDQPCRRLVSTDGQAGLVEAYLWPSGGRTIVTRSQNRAQVNGAAATSDFGDRRGMQFCLRNGDSGNTFCFAER